MMPAAPNAWTPRHQALLDALSAEALLPKLRLALALPADGSVSADLDLLAALRAEPSLRDALGWLAGGAAPSGFAAQLDALYPASLQPRALHHLALLYIEQPAQRARGLLGWLWLWEHHGPYLHAVARAAAHDLTTVEEVVASMPAHLLSDDATHLLHLGADAALGATASATWSALEALAAALARHGAPRAAAAAQAALSEAAAAAIDRVITTAEADFALTEQAILNAANDAPCPDLDLLLRAPRRLVDHIGHAEALSVWVIQRCVKLAWSLYKRSRFEDIRALSTLCSAFAKDLEAHLQRGAAFGRQGDLADLMVLSAASIEGDDAKQPLLRRALRASPIHRNARLALASSNLRIAQKLLNTFALALRRRDPANDIASAARLIDEAAELRPAHEDLAAARAALQRAQARLT
jgi:hypothetical protein